MRARARFGSPVSAPPSSRARGVAAPLGVAALVLAPLIPAFFPAPALAASVAHRLQLTITGAGVQARLGHSVAGAGDVNGDGYADLILGGRDIARVYHGGPGADATADLSLSAEASGDGFGLSVAGAGVAGAGDVNGDGFADVIVGASGNDAGGTNAGRAYVFFGGPGADAVADLVLTGEAAGDRLGESVAGAGDVNGDGFDDVIVGARFNDANGADAGRAYVFYGGPGADATADLVLTGVAADDNFGHAVAGVGDVNGDGFADVVVGAPLNDAGGSNAGRAYVFFGGVVANNVADLVLTGQAAGDLFGASVAGAGDVNGDGFADVMVGAYLNDAGGTNAGRAYVFHGGVVPDIVADLTLTGQAAGEFFGLSVAGAGDANGDGFADLIVGAPFNDAGGTDAGRAYFYHGGPGADAVPDLTLTGEAAGDRLGGSVAGAGDVNDDGFDDLLVGAGESGAGGFLNGRAYLHDWYRYVVLSPNGGETWDVGSTRRVAWLGAEPADVSLSLDGGLTYRPIRRGAGGAASNAIALLVPHGPTRFARVRVSPSDPSVSGLDDSDSLFTIRTSVALLSFAVRPAPSGGAELFWSTDPGIGAEGLAGYRLYRLEPRAGGTGTRIGPELIAGTRYLDAGGRPGHTYRLVAVNGLMQELEVGRETLAAARPLAAWPLPYRGGELTISFAAASAPGGGPGAAELTIYDVTGRLARTVARGSFAAGHHTAAWDGRDDGGRRVPAGVYLLRARTGGEVRQLKLLVMP